MFKHLTALAAATFAVPALAAAQSEPVRFDHEGTSYVYTVADAGDAQIIRGKVLDSGKKFVLRVSDSGRVTGRVNGRPVSFQANEAAFAAAGSGTGAAPTRAGH